MSVMNDKVMEYRIERCAAIERARLNLVDVWVFMPEGCESDAVLDALAALTKYKKDLDSLVEIDDPAF
jgi:hypothetical protein